MNTQFVNKDAEFMLESFLTAPAVGYDTTKTVVDIIAEDYAINDMTRTDDLFKKFFQKTEYTNGNDINDILLNVNGKKIKMTTQNGVGGFVKFFTPIGGVIFEKNNAYTSIPGYGTTIYVSLRVSEAVILGEANTGAQPKGSTNTPNTNTSVTPTSTPAVGWGT